MKIFRLNFEQEGVVLAQNVTCEQSFRMRFYIGIWYANFFSLWSMSMTHPTGQPGGEARSTIHIHCEEPGG